MGTYNMVFQIFSMGENSAAKLFENISNVQNVGDDQLNYGVRALVYKII